MILCFRGSRCWRPPPDHTLQLTGVPPCWSVLITTVSSAKSRFRSQIIARFFYGAIQHFIEGATLLEITSKRLGSPSLIALYHAPDFRSDARTLLLTCGQSGGFDETVICILIHGRIHLWLQSHRPAERALPAASYPRREYNRYDATRASLQRR